MDELQVVGRGGGADAPHLVSDEYGRVAPGRDTGQRRTLIVDTVEIVFDRLADLIGPDGMPDPIEFRRAKMSSRRSAWADTSGPATSSRLNASI